MTDQPVTSGISEAEKQKIEQQNKIRFALKKLDEMKQLFQYLQGQCKNRSDRKQFKRDFISNDKFAISLIDKVVAYYEVSGSQSQWEEKQSSLLADIQLKKE